MNSTAKRMVVMVVIVGIIFACIFGFEMFRSKMIKQYMHAMVPVQTISTMPAHYQDWQATVSAVGSLRAVKGADLSLEVAGIVDQIAFNSGDEVQAGAMLLRLRDADDQAKLQSLQATADLANTTYARDKKQFEAKAISQAVLDVDASTLKSDQAAVAEQRAIVEKKTLHAPFAGRLGVRLVDLGQYLNSGTAVVTLQALDPIYADFYLPAAQVGQLAVGRKVSVKVNSDDKSTLNGEISAINPRVEADSRTVLVRATVHNPTQKFLPGAPVTVEIAVGQTQRYLTLPQTAVAYSPYGDTVFLAVENGKDDKGQPKLEARQTFVTTGLTRGDQVAIVQGIKENDAVVTAGQIKLRNGLPVVINNSVQPADNPNPKPVDH